MTTVWLLLTVAMLIVVCVVLYSGQRQLESTFHARQSLVADELREAEERLAAAAERIERLDERLAAREARLYREGEADTQLGRGSTLHTPRSTLGSGGSPRTEGPRGSPGNSGSGPGAWSLERGARTERAHTQREQTVRLARAGRTPVQIARALNLRVGEVELLLALGRERTKW